MNLLDRYIARTLLGAVALVMAVLLVLGLLFEFIGEQSSIGVGQYGAFDALLYSAMSLPQFALESFPAATLIGALLGIGVLARSHELTVMRASGMSKWRLSVSVLSTAVVLIAAALAIGEFLAPPLQQLADQQKAFEKYADVSFAGPGGAWLRDGDTILNIQQRAGLREYGGMYVFELTGENRIAAIGRAARATAAGSAAWRLSDYAESSFRDDHVSATTVPERIFKSAASADFLTLAVADPSQLALHTLYSLMDYLRANNLELRQYEFAFWARIARTAGILAALLFALPFGFGSLRSTGSGARTTLGLGLGIVYFFLQRTVESGAQVFALDPLLLAWVPTGLLLLAAAILLRRVR